MQLQLTLEELKLLADLLDQRDTTLRRKIDQANTDEARQGLQRKQTIGNVLLDKIIACDLRFAADELDNLSDILLELESDLRLLMTQAPDSSEAKAEIGHRKQLLGHIKDKVTEVCAMA